MNKLFIRTEIMNLHIIVLTLILFVIINSNFYSQAILKADGPGNTYELINSILAPGYNAVENPECVHPEFGRHIAEVYDSTLNDYVFEFYAHVTPDNDRCINFDRQRIEIKTYSSSPDDLKGVIGETVVYKWKFRIPKGYQPSYSFTHLHQIKAVGGDDGMPIFTLTARKSNPNKMELIHDNVLKAVRVDLSLFEGEWVECTETVYIHPYSGKYSISIIRMKDDMEVLAYSKENLMTIRTDNSFIRPKWGIYRSLNAPSDLRDEAVRFNDFSINEVPATLIKDDNNSIPEKLFLAQNYPNPFNPSTTIEYYIPKSSKVSLKILDILGNEVAVLVDEFQQLGNHSFNFEVGDLNLTSGVYFYKLESNENFLIKKMIFLK